MVSLNPVSDNTFWRISLPSSADTRAIFVSLSQRPVSLLGPSGQRPGLEDFSVRKVSPSFLNFSEKLLQLFKSCLNHIF
jgi:hypothetical protein